MVLHNNKWDKRAKYKYLKKHGLLKKQQQAPQSPQDADGKETAISDEEDADISENLKNNEQIIADDASSNGQDRKVPSEEALITEEMIITAMNEAKKVEDEEFLKYVNLTKNATNVYKLPAKRQEFSKEELLRDKNLEDLTFDQLKRLDLDSSDSDDEVDSGSKTKNNKQKVFSEEDKEKFQQLQKKIEQDYLFRNIKNKFNHRTNVAGKQQSIDIDDISNKKVFDQNLAELIGETDLSSTKSVDLGKMKKPNNQSLEDLLNLNIEPAHHEASKTSNAKVPIPETSDADDKLLNELLDL